MRSYRSHYQRRSNSRHALYSVVAEPDGANVGTLDEDFAIESNHGDIMLLGNTFLAHSPHRIQNGPRPRRRRSRCPAHDSLLGRGEAPARTDELSLASAISAKPLATCCPTLLLSASRNINPRSLLRLHGSKTNADSTTPAASNSVEYILEGRGRLGAVSPPRKRSFAERFFDEGGGMQLVIHAPFGGRVQQSLGSRPTASVSAAVSNFETPGRSHR